ncbi:MAG: hypothetical protein LBI53_08255 [Candidatus Peribacteria bacterium]|jgi:hypothetical protein|nr:hypothetical protein [Candidatus Peribacteria bacterium]
MRKYARITTLRKEEDTLKISAPRSNQIVAGRQILGDDQGPEGTAKLKRLKTNNEIVSEGDGLEGFVGTYYTIEVEREDNVELASMQIEYNGIIIKEEKVKGLTGSIAIG